MAAAGPPAASDIPSVPPSEWTLADFLTQIGGIPPERIRMFPPPGTATENNILTAEGHTGRVCELIDGVLVEKTMGYLESLLAGIIVHEIWSFLQTHDLGVVLGADGTLRILPRRSHARRVLYLLGAVSGPAASPRADSRPGPRSGRRSHFRGEHRGGDAAEISRLFRRRRAAGVVHRSSQPHGQSYTAADRCVELVESQSLSGGDVLPGFELSLGSLFAKIGQ